MNKKFFEKHSLMRLLAAITIFLPVSFNAQAQMQAPPTTIGTGTCYTFIENCVLNLSGISSLGWSANAAVQVNVGGSNYFDITSNVSYQDNANNAQYTVLASNPGQNPPSLPGGSHNYFLVFNMRLKTGKTADNIYVCPRPDGFPDQPRTNNAAYTRKISDYAALVDCIDTWVVIPFTFASPNWFRISFIDPDDALLLRDFYLCTATPDVAIFPKTNVTLTEIGCNSIKVNFSEVANAASYEIYRCTSNDVTTCRQLVHTANAAGEYVDNGLDVGTQYYYMVKTIAADCHISLSDIQTATTNALAVPVITSTLPTLTSIYFTFTLAAGATSHALYRSTSENGVYAQVAEYTGTETFTDENLTAGTKYFYKIEATFADGCVSRDRVGVKTITLPAPYNCAASDCNGLVGYVNFAKRDGTETGRWSINDIDLLGTAVETLTFGQNANTTGFQATGNLTTNSKYLIVKNPSSIVGGNGDANTNEPNNILAKQLMDIPDLPGGMLLIKGNDGNNAALTYTISGLNSRATASGDELKYCVRIKLYNVGTPSRTEIVSWLTPCQNNGNNIDVNIRRLTNNDAVQNANNQGAVEGTWTTVSHANSPCHNHDTPIGGTLFTNVSGDVNGNNVPTSLQYGDYTIVQCIVTVGNDDGFKIRIRPNADRNVVKKICRK